MNSKKFTLLAYTLYIALFVLVSPQLKAQVEIISDGTWKANAALIPGWDQPGFDDSGWDFATSPPPIAPLTIVVDGADPIWVNMFSPSAYFRKTFDLRSSPRSARIEVSADNQFRLYVNGTFLQYWQDQDAIYSVDVTDLLSCGENLIAIEGIETSDLGDGTPSMVSAKLTIDTNFVSSNIVRTICDGESFEGYDQTGFYTDVFLLPDGCDSTRFIDLTVVDEIETIIDQTICDGEFFEGYDETGTYEDIFSSQQGCDSIRIINLTVEGLGTSSIDTTICAGEIAFGYDASGTYEDIFQTPNGCDSTRTVTLTVLPPSNETIVTNICQGESFEGYSVSGTYIDILQNQNNCDSTRTIVLTVLDEITTTVDQEICEGEVVEGYTEAGTYVDVFQSQGGCDSVRTLNLSVITEIQTEVSTIICEGEEVFGYSEAGVYVDQLVGVNGCDSIRTLRLEVLPSVSTTVNASICQGEIFEGYTFDGIYEDIFVGTNGCDSIRILNLEVSSIDEIGTPSILAFPTGCNNRSGRIEVLLNSNSTDVLYKIDEEGTFQKSNIFDGLGIGTYTLFISDQAECITITEEFEILVDCPAFVPNAFSPNDDGINDFFTIYGQQDQISNIKVIKIFDRYGGLVFEAENIAPNVEMDGWDGTKNGEDLHSGVYVYYAEIEYLNTQTELISGEVALVR